MEFLDLDGSGSGRGTGRTGNLFALLWAHRAVPGSVGRAQRGLSTSCPVTVGTAQQGGWGPGAVTLSAPWPRW